MERPHHIVTAVSILFLLGEFCTKAQVAGSLHFPLRLGNEWMFARQSSPHTGRISDTANVLGHLYYGLTTIGSTPDEWFRVSNDSVLCWTV